MPEEAELKKDRLKPELILMAEFAYIAQTAFQANEDRARVSNYYLVTAGAAVAAIFNTRVDPASSLAMYIGFCSLFTVLSLIGLNTLLQLARLRSAWGESARAMNAIKEFYITHLPEVDLKQAFAWSSASMPQMNKPRSIAFLLAMSVILVDLATAAAAVVYLGMSLGASFYDLTWLATGMVVAAVFAFIQYRWYLGWLGK